MVWDVRLARWPNVLLNRWRDEGSVAKEQVDGRLQRSENGVGFAAGAHLVHGRRLVAAYGVANKRQKCQRDAFMYMKILHQIQCDGAYEACRHTSSL